MKRSLAVGVALLLAALVALGVVAPAGGQEKPDKPRPEAKPAPKDDDDADDGEGDGLDDVDPDSPNLKPPASLTGAHLTRFQEAVGLYDRGRLELVKREKTWRRTTDAALAAFKKCAPDDAKNALPSYYQGILYQWLGDPKKAIAQLVNALERNAKFHEAMIELADCYQKENRPKDAEAQLAKALALKPDLLRAHLRVAYLRIFDGKFADARAIVNKVLAEKASHATAKTLKKKLDQVVDGPDWGPTFEKETAHYIVKTDVDQALADEVARHAELIRRLYESIFKEAVPSGGPKKFPIIVYKDRAEYRKFGGPKQAGGHFDPMFRQLYLFKYEKWSDTTLVLYHEGFHQFLEPYVRGAPQWFNEGLADYFGPSQYVKEPKEGMKIVPNPWRLDLVKRLLGSGRAIPMSQLMLMSQAEMYDEETAGNNYAQAWSFIYFLCEYQDRKYFPILGRYYKELRKGKDNESAYKETFGKEDMAKLEREWRQFIASVR